jgi:hypothetical protein
MTAPPSPQSLSVEELFELRNPALRAVDCSHSTPRPKWFRVSPGTTKRKTNDATLYIGSDHSPYQRGSGSEGV